MIGIKIMIVGDTHAGLKNILPKLSIAKKLGIQHVLQVGDFGYFPTNMEGLSFLDEIQVEAQKNNLSVYAIPGNHEDHDAWEYAVKSTLPKHKGFTLVRSRILLSPKVNTWRWDDKTFMVAGGAVSVDKEWRLAAEERACAPRTYWWPNEELTDNDVQKIRMLGKKVDYLITHDASNNTAFRFRLKTDPDSERHRRRIDSVISLTKPNMHFHGHYHTKYDWENGMSCGYEHHVKTYGFECDTDWNSWGVLDTQTNKFLWRGEDAVESE